MIIDHQQSNSDDIRSHLPKQVTYFNSGNNNNGSGVQYNGEINIDYDKLHHMYCSCENWKFTPNDEVKLEYTDMEVGKSISEVVNNIAKKNSGRQFFCFNTGNNINKSGTQTSGGINFHFMEVYNFHHACQNLKHRLDEAKFAFTDIEAVRQIPEAENIILLKKSDPDPDGQG